MPRNPLAQTLDTIRSRIQLHRGEGVSEEGTKIALINPLLRDLGWDTENLHEVSPEFSSAGGRVDYALLIDNQPRLLVEAKALDTNLDSPKLATQLTVYAVTTGVRWAVLTNGDEYRIFNAYAEVPIEEKVFTRVRISDGHVDSGQVLSLLSRSATLRALLDAHWQEELDKRERQRVDQHVLDALRELFVQEPPDASLVRLLRKQVGDLTPSDIREGLRRTIATFESSPDQEVTARIPEPLNPSISKPPPAATKASDVPDTVVVPARERNFHDTFLSENRWYAVNISEELIPRMKYIAVYRTTPVSAITHVALVKSIEPWEGSEKFVVNFSAPAEEIGPIKLGRGIPPAGRRYTSKAALEAATSIADLWGINPKAELKQIIDAQILNPPFEVFATYRGQKQTARIERDGTLTFQSQKYQSLSGAGAAAKRAAGYAGPKPATQGWTFWKFIDDDGLGKPINALRRRFLKQQES